MGKLAGPKLAGPCKGPGPVEGLAADPGCKLAVPGERSRQIRSPLKPKDPKGSY